MSFLSFIAALLLSTALAIAFLLYVAYSYLFQKFLFVSFGDRRFCGFCGQRQYHVNGAWKDDSNKPNPSCKCHQFTS